MLVNKVKGKKILPLIAIMMIASVAAAGIAYQYWASQTFTKQVNIAAVFTAYCNVVDFTEIEYVGGATGWSYSGIVTLSNELIDGNLIRIIPDVVSNNIPTDNAYMKIAVAGTYVTAGGKVAATIKTYTISASEEVKTLVNTFTIPDVSVMSPQLLTNFLKLQGSHPMVEVTLSWPTSIPFGDYTCTAVVELTDGS